MAGYRTVIQKFKEETPYCSIQMATGDLGDSVRFWKQEEIFAYGPNAICQAGAVDASNGKDRSVYMGGAKLSGQYVQQLQKWVGKYWNG